MTAIDAINRARHFALGEFPRTAQEVDPELIARLDAFRAALGRAIHPSRDPGGWVRHEGSPGSRHHVSNADAGDVFPEGDVLSAFLLALRFFGGVGIYYDTDRSRLQPGPMLHVDLRAEPLVWARENGRYVYPAAGPTDSALFWSLAAKHAQEH